MFGPVRDCILIHSDNEVAIQWVPSINRSCSIIFRSTHYQGHEYDTEFDSIGALGGVFIDSRQFVAQADLPGESDICKTKSPCRSVALISIKLEVSISELDIAQVERTRQADPTPPYTALRLSACLSGQTFNWKNLADEALHLNT